MLLRRHSHYLPMTLVDFIAVVIIGVVVCFDLMMVMMMMIMNAYASCFGSVVLARFG